MSEPEGFLTRWNRRKQEAKRDGDAASAPERDDARDPRDALETDGVAGKMPAHSGAARPAVSKDAPPASTAGSGTPNETFDVSTLPPIETITAQSDIRAFLAKGVPAELTRAALRRAWSADPAIRDFIGIAENQWDFTAPNEIIGFGPLESGEDIARLVAKVFGDAPSQDGSGPDDQNLSAQSTGTKVAHAAPVETLPAAVSGHETAPENIVHRSENTTAAQIEEKVSDDLETAHRRGHGRALPQ